MRSKKFCSVLICFNWLALSAQPANDDCINALQLEFADDYAEVVLVDGDTRGATASTTPVTLCSQSFYTDDVWYTFITPQILPPDGIIIEAYFDNLINPTDLPHVGMAVYAGCDFDEPIVSCYVDDDPKLNKTELPSVCLMANQEYMIRIWSGGADSSTEGTFQIGVFAAPPTYHILWWETFGGGLEVNGWTTYGTCDEPDSNGNAGWKYLPDGLLDQGAYIFAGAGINSPSVCDGAVGVDSDYDDNFGLENFFGKGPCPAPAQHTLISPEINTSAWSAIGLSIQWNQMIRNFLSTFVISFRIKDGEEPWSDWEDILVNTEFAPNSDLHFNDIQRHFMPGAAGHDLLQIRFIYNANYYMWGIDDVKIVETEANNLRVLSDFVAIAPWAAIPASQVFPFAALANIRNAGASEQTNVVLNHTVRNLDSQTEIYNEDLVYGRVVADSTYENRLNPKLIVLPSVQGNYTGTYTLTQDQEDFDDSDNGISFNYSVGGDRFALEDGFTRSFTPSFGVFPIKGPPSFAYGNYFRPVYTTGAQTIEWGVNNPEEMTGKTVQIYLLQWTDHNGNQIAEVEERDIIGFSDYTFTGEEGENVILSSTLTNFINPGEPVTMKGGKGYMAIVEYQAQSIADPHFYMLASEARDYTAQQLAMDTAYAYGLTDMPIYFSVLGWSIDGIITNIDYEVKELDPNDNRIFFGNDIVPVVRIHTYDVDTTSTHHPLAFDQIISVYPNPASESLHINLEFTKQHHHTIIHLMNSLGQRILTRTFSTSLRHHTEILDVKGLAAGSYYIQVETSEGQRIIPFIILR